ncbi:MAG: hypothetical protein QNJ63_16360 [Calothrix sp. MO_192.B10]|nr:hypothetical protein [Calothrix sp. MO_192.B10]
MSLEYAQRFGDVTQQDVTTVLADVLKMLCPTLENFSDSNYSPISTLSDTEILSLADGKMDAVQNQRLGELQAKGKSTGLNAAERYELLALMQIYQIGQLRKSQALVEAVNRGLRNPLNELCF